MVEIPGLDTRKPEVGKEFAQSRAEQRPGQLRRAPGPMTASDSPLPAPASGKHCIIGS